MNKVFVVSLLTTLTTVVAALTVQFPQHAVWFTIAGTVAGGLLKSPFFADVKVSP